MPGILIPQNLGIEASCETNLNRKWVQKKCEPSLMRVLTVILIFLEIMTIFTYEDINDYKSLINKFSPYLFEILIIPILLS